MNPYDKARELAQSIQSSEVARRLKDTKERIEQDSSTLAVLQEYRYREWELQTKLVDGQELTEAERESIDKLRNMVQSNPDIAVYLEAERQLTVMLMDIQDILSQTMDEFVFSHPGETDTAELD
ncbi:YlbF family regulator [Alicyclobacillus sp. SO9]|uniref:YlbF family regulator n=1 Tax=Alicyclobacillus sp. SO9 TaxID=2665646 RepID=UPI0018E7A6C5|nr:YlbF family regulator [Alicyclobacillus sp. SO9]QQE78037.1 YlbF family regulator [Alicyclobacillus sp. SO9]